MRRLRPVSPSCLCGATRRLSLIQYGVWRMAYGLALSGVKVLALYFNELFASGVVVAG